MQDNKCTGECIKCSFQQQNYCAAQKGYAIMTYMPAIIERLDKIESEMPRFLSENVFNPMEEKAQKHSGAENREDKL